MTLPVWITEMRWSTALRTQYAVSDGTQAAYMRQAIRLALNGWGAYVSHIFVFGWYRSNSVVGDWEDNLGFLGPTGTPKPAWGAITKLLRGSSAAAAESCALCPTAT